MGANSTRLYVVMGVAGCGKSTVGHMLAKRLGGAYLEGDQLHPASNIEKMSSGIPLTDEDRWPWLEQIGAHFKTKQGIVIAGCSALKRTYREAIIAAAKEDVCFIHLEGSRELIASRMGAREGHFMPTSLLDSQFSTLEPPSKDENAVGVNIDQPLEKLIDDICEKI